MKLNRDLYSDFLILIKIMGLFLRIFFNIFFYDKFREKFIRDLLNIICKR